MKPKVGSLKGLITLTNFSLSQEKKKTKTQITKIRNEIWDIITDLAEIRKIIREYYEQ